MRNVFFQAHPSSVERHNQGLSLVLREPTDKSECYLIRRRPEHQMLNAVVGEVCQLELSENPKKYTHSGTIFNPKFKNLIFKKIKYLNIKKKKKLKKQVFSEIVTKDLTLRLKAIPNSLSHFDPLGKVPEV